MQEVRWDNSEGIPIVKESLEALLPYIEEALKKPMVKYVKVFRVSNAQNKKDVFKAKAERATLEDFLKESADEQGEEKE